MRGTRDRGESARTRARTVRHWLLATFLVTGAAAAMLCGASSPAQAQSGDGQVLFQKCTANDCSKVENETALYLRTGSFKILDGFAGIGWDGMARLRLAADPAHDKVASMVDVKASISWNWFSPTLNLKASTPVAWQDAFGLRGMTLSGVSFGGSFDLFTQRPNLTVAANATLPTVWAEDFAVQVNAPISFSAKINYDAPVLALTIGRRDGTVSLKPLFRTGIPDGNKVIDIDDASLVVAPKGGTVNGKTFQPGIWLGFAGEVAGRAVSLDARYYDTDRRLVGNGRLDHLDVGALSVDGWRFDFDLAPGSVNANMSGSVGLLGGPTLSVAGAARTTPSCQICVTFDANASNVTLGSVTLETLHVALAANLDTVTVVDADLDARMAVLGQPVDVAGGLTITNGDLSRFSIAGATGPICPRPAVCLTGSNALGGPNFTGTYDSTATPKFDIRFDGTLTADKLSVALNGRINDQGASFGGTLRVDPVANVTVSGQFYQGPNLAGVKAKRADGVLVQVAQGDWRADASGTVNTTLSGSRFTGNLRFDAGSVAGDEWVNATGAVNVNNPATNTDLNGSVTGTFRGLTNGSLDYALTVTGSGRFRGYTASGRVSVTPSTLSVDATTYVPDLGTSILFRGNGTFNCTATCSATYDLYGEADFRLNGIRAHGWFRLNDTSGIRAVVDAAGTKSGMGFNAHFDTTVPDGGTVCANASASAWIDNAPYFGGRMNFSGSVSYCNRQVAGNLFSATANFTQYTGEVFDVVGWFRAGVDVHAQFRITVNNDGFVVTGYGTGDVFSEQKFLFTSNWCCRINYAPVTLNVANNRVTVKVKVLFWDVTLYSEYFPYLTQSFEGWD